MPYKVTCTIVWKVNSNTEEEARQIARQHMNDMVGLDEDEINHDIEMRLDLVYCKKIEQYQHIKEYTVEEINPLIGQGKTDFVVDGVTHHAYLNSDRFKVFQRHTACVACGLEGTRYVLDVRPGCQAQLNLYGVEDDGRLLLMTKDHIVPRSRGGANNLSNYATMCCVCNGLKSNFDLEGDQIIQLRNLARNPDNVTRRELTKQIKELQQNLSRVVEEKA